MNTMGIKSAHLPNTMGIKQQRASHTMGLKTHMVFRNNSAPSVPSNDVVTDHDNLGQYEPILPKGIKKGKKSGLEK